MPSEWRRLTLREAGVELIDCDHRTPPAVETGFPYVAIPQLIDGHIRTAAARQISEQHFVEWTRKACPQRGDIVLSRRCNPGTTAVVPNGLQFALGQNLVLLRCNSAIVAPEFLRWAVRGPEWWDEVNRFINVGAVFDSLRCRDIPEFTLTFPPLDQQRSMGLLLSLLDDRIELLREENQTLQAIARSIFKSWFVDFDPVKAKAEGREPEDMDAATAALFPSEFQDSEIGPIPEGWSLVPFGNLLTNSIGGDWGTESFEGPNTEGVYIVRGTDMPGLRAGQILNIPFRYVTAKKLSARRLVPGDIVVEVSGGSKNQPTGRSLYFSDLLLDQFESPVVPASFCRLFRPSTLPIGTILNQHLQYIYDLGKTWSYQNQSTGISNFQTAHFLEAEQVVVPPDGVLKRFHSLIDPLVRRTDSGQIRLLASVRDTLLPRLISGELRVPEAEEMLAEVV